MHYTELLHGHIVPQGSNWMVSPDPDSGQGEILSQNLEEGAAADGPVVASNCASDAADAGPFLVHHDRFGWREDRDLGGDAVQTLQLRLLSSGCTNQTHFRVDISLAFLEYWLSYILRMC